MEIIYYRRYTQMCWGDIQPICIYYIVVIMMDSNFSKFFFYSKETRRYDHKYFAVQISPLINENTTIIIN